MSQFNVVLIRSVKLAAWKSCQSIGSNLQRAYQLALPDSSLSIISIHDEMSEFDLNGVAKEIFNKQPSVISFVDYKPHPDILLPKLIEVFGEATFPEIYVHVYGDFILYADRWMDLESDLLKKRVKFIAASDSQNRLVSSLALSSHSVTSFPFPVNPDEFFFSDPKESYKKKGETLFVYTGRLSLQKNILELIETFDYVSKNLRDDIRLLLVGPIDDLGIPYLSIYLQRLAYSQKLGALLEHLQNDKISILPNQDTDNLREIYQAADYYLNMSTHNDEDYGMAPAEALMCGTPTILTAWGGFHSFKNLVSDYVEMIPVIRNEERISFDSKALSKSLLKARPVSKEKRIELALCAKERLGITNGVHKLREIFSERALEFTGFSDLMKEIAITSQRGTRANFSKSKTVYSDLYERLYRPYFGANDE